MVHSLTPEHLAKKAASPAATGPGGAHFEAKAGAYYLLALLLDADRVILEGYIYPCQNRISKKGAEFADQIKAAAAMADKEEEIRIESEKQLASIQKDAGIKLEGKHKFTFASGRVDSVYSRVIIEYKNPKSADKIGPKANSPGSKKVVEQIK
jgi:hypothetical protein